MRVFNSIHMIRACQTSLLAKDVRRIQFKAVNPKPQRRFMMVVHNRFDFQDALVLYSFESLFEKGEIKYVRNISINQTCILKACCSILTSGKPNWRKKSYRPIRRKKILARNTLKRPVSWEKSTNTTWKISIAVSSLSGMDWTWVKILDIAIFHFTFIFKHTLIKCTRII